ncbi:hypothetical protein PanWU01x14_066960 [Parasponia andersonii]|uniref:Uncharacterized protein n=1 Tax=Parasponia andersonii TaxID=3476 RepID=A0A2P5DG94_PARAD|nr:hypothetical protein PanWU01x14_066960 [Parasponia andersonii]
MEFVRFNNRQSSRQKKLVMTPDLSRRKAEPPAPDLTDFMNDMFFGTLKTDKKVYNLTGTEHTEAIVSDQEDKGKDKDKDREQEDKDKCADLVEESPRRSSTSGRLTQEWLDEARRLVASSPSRCDSPSRLVGSPRFAAAQGSPSSLASSLDRRDPLSRSARRYRAVESFSGEILSKSAKHSRNKSETLATGDSPAPGSPTELLSPASVVHNWFSNIVKPSNPTTPTPPQQNFEPEPRVPTLLSRPSLLRKSRFQTDPSSPGPQGIPTPSGRSSQSGPITLLTETHLLSPPKNLIESAQRRSVSSSTCSVEKIASKLSSNGLPSESGEIRELGLNGFLKERRIKVGKILGGGANAKAKIILSGPSNS